MRNIDTRERRPRPALPSSEKRRRKICDFPEAARFARACHFPLFFHSAEQPKRNIMSVSFPAFHEQQIQAVKPASELLQLIKNQASQLHWRYLQKNEDMLSFKVGVSWSSWGEKVHVSWSKDAIIVRSECALPLQCFDWGKNQENVRALCASLAA